MEAKPFASLSAGLLARKGAARPAMRRPHMTGMAVPTLPVSVQEDDLGWNDMGEGHQDDAPRPVPPLTMVGAKERAAESAEAPPAVVEQQQELEQSLSQAKAVQPAQPKVKPKPKGATPVSTIRRRGSKAAFTLRLDPDRHLRLRLASAVDNRSAQQILTQALDAYLDSQPQVEALAKQVPSGTDKTESN